MSTQDNQEDEYHCENGQPAFTFSYKPTTFPQDATNNDQYYETTVEANRTLTVEVRFNPKRYGTYEGWACHVRLSKTDCTSWCRDQQIPELQWIFPLLGKCSDNGDESDSGEDNEKEDGKRSFIAGVAVSNMEIQKADDSFDDVGCDGERRIPLQVVVNDDDDGGNSEDDDVGGFPSNNNNNNNNNNKNNNKNNHKKTINNHKNNNGKNNNNNGKNNSNKNKNNGGMTNVSELGNVNFSFVIYLL